MPKYFISKIISGGQTGVDRAALDIAKKLGIPYGGWCPKGRWSEDGAISLSYENMIETPSAEPEQRTEWNARDSDGTLIITKDQPMGGTLYTIQMAEKHHKPHFIFNADKTIDELASWIKNNNIQKLNIAGPRASQSSGIYELAFNILQKMMVHSELLSEPDAQSVRRPKL